MRILLVGGGTTGHISPMLATAEALRSLEPQVELTCVGTAIGLETTVVPAAGFELRCVDPVPFPRKISLRMLSFPWRLSKAVRQAKTIIRELGIEVVVGFGGYACPPVYLAARKLKIPIVVHEANAIPGLANRMGARYAACVCATFPGTGLPGEIVTGMPIRHGIATLDRSLTRASARAELSLDPSASVLLVSGGSQGAMSLNHAIWEAASDLGDRGISIVHITGKNNAHLVPEGLPDSYHHLAYVDGMEKAYSVADLMLARAGAATVVETATVGLPTIFVPLPHGNGEQERNARTVVEAGGGILLPDHELSSPTLLDLVPGLLHEETLMQMSLAARGVFPRNSAELVAHQVLEVVRGGS
ncbi:MAG: undecaprenyldiphospho-muramoylpentapeptide beta-N-acetylglucosaminyltransferase [Propionibacteriaceae bacterium]|nr:undecaprenyldiphospho-muramoylpentapeptide beta-N-acetylglucosaminyltransferase [Propionibacteriaceae bacterium]